MANGVRTLSVAAVKGVAFLAASRERRKIEDQPELLSGGVQRPMG